MTPSKLPVAQIRAHVPFPGQDGTRIEVLIDGEVVAQLQPLSVAYDMDWNRGLPIITARFIAGDADIETKPPPRAQDLPAVDRNRAGVDMPAYLSALDDDRPSLPIPDSPSTKAPS